MDVDKRHFLITEKADIGLTVRRLDTKVRETGFSHRQILIDTNFHGSDIMRIFDVENVLEKL